MGYKNQKNTFSALTIGFENRKVTADVEAQSDFRNSPGAITSDHTACHFKPI
jgi:hypothetical protein